MLQYQRELRFMSHADEIYGSVINKSIHSLWCSISFWVNN